MRKNDNGKSILRSNVMKRAGSVSCAVLLLAVVSILVFPTTGAALESCGEGNPGKKILVANESKHGSTSDYAVEIGEVLCDNGFQVDTGLISEIDDISSYEGVVVGSPIYWGTLLPTFEVFLNTNRAALADPDVDVAFFLVSNFIIKPPPCPPVCPPPFEPFVPPAAFWLFAYSTVLKDYPDIFPGLNLILFPCLAAKEFPNCEIPYWVGLFPGKYNPRDAYPVEYIGMDLNGFGPNNDVNLDVSSAWTQNLIDNGFPQ